MSSGSTKTSWNDITVEDFLKLQDIGNLQLATEDEKNMKVAALVNGIDYNEIIQVPLSKVREYMDATDFLLHKPTPNKVRRKYVLNGRTYVLLKDKGEMSVAQYIDYQTIQADGFDKRPAELLSIMLVPEGHNYNDGYDKDEQIEDMLSLPIPDALGVCDFFVKRLSASINLILKALRLRMKLMRITARKEEREMMKAMELEMNLYLDQLRDTFGLIVPGL